MGSFCTIWHKIGNIEPIFQHAKLDMLRQCVGGVKLVLCDTPFRVQI